MNVTTGGSRRNFLRLGAAATVGAGLVGCGAADKASSEASTLVSTTATDAPVTTAEEVLKLLAEGNKRYAEFKSMPLNEDEAQRIEVSQGQHPFATIISCVDSRVPPELVFDRGLGDLFVIRSAGEALDKAVTGSVEFGVVEFSSAARDGSRTPKLRRGGRQHQGPGGGRLRPRRARLDRLPGQGDHPGRQSRPRGNRATCWSMRWSEHQARGHPAAQIAFDRSCRAWGQARAVGGYYSLETGLVEVMSDVAAGP